MAKKILIEGMSCEHCVAHVKEALEEIGGENINVNLKKKLALISNDIEDKKIKAAIENAGYEVIKVEETSDSGESKLKGFFKKITK
ncbi:heavy-metal-associated domain-containing protein [Clostridium felsineum]|uniref:Uncharacterized protein n=1 Tax=Clostridium felsineum TaxID=36839 RepID=A0A1S8KXN4_9CLOT|nr:heavy-metal-associated domain-containing protein [Clostridium felsineum]MCR3760509.1 heavy-metal-associated domain-containing protein [Clostridium felsineum]URZ08770.1 hypothetical protein CLROS_041640 [Clostridium felsineum]URZ09398.1 hypothetical protein CROST_000690 [Clostridium felsineum]URZ14246.1 hypothetical protein CLFE_002310 [Clostridium felsineum DSM 794]